MNEQDERVVKEALRKSFLPVDTDLRRNLWPDLLRRIDAQSPSVPWYDWALIAAMAALLLYFPQLVLVFAYHL